MIVYKYLRKDRSSGHLEFRLNKKTKKWEGKKVEWVPGKWKKLTNRPRYGGIRICSPYLYHCYRSLEQATANRRRHVDDTVNVLWYAETPRVVATDKRAPMPGSMYPNGCPETKLGVRKLRILSRVYFRGKRQPVPKVEKSKSTTKRR